MVSPMKSVWNIARRNNRNFFKDVIRQYRDNVLVSEFRGMLEDEIVAVGFRPREEAVGMLAQIFYPGDETLLVNDEVEIDNRDGTIRWRVLTSSTGRTFDPHDTAYVVRNSDEQITVTVRLYRRQPGGETVVIGDYDVFMVYEHRVPVIGEDEGALTRSVQVRLVTTNMDIPIQRGDAFMTLDEDVQGTITDVRKMNTRIEAHGYAIRGYQRPEV